MSLTPFERLLNPDIRFLIYDELLRGQVLVLDFRLAQNTFHHLTQAFPELKNEIEFWASKCSNFHPILGPFQPQTTVFVALGPDPGALERKILRHSFLAFVLQRLRLGLVARRKRRWKNLPRVIRMMLALKHLEVELSDEQALWMTMWRRHSEWLLHQLRFMGRGNLYRGFWGTCGCCRLPPILKQRPGLHVLRFEGHKGGQVAEQVREVHRCKWWDQGWDST